MKGARSLQSPPADVQQPLSDSHVVEQAPYYMTAEECARYLRYASVKALYNAVPRLNIPCRRRGPQFLFIRAELDRWLEGHRAHNVAIFPKGRRRA